MKPPYEDTLEVVGYVLADWRARRIDECSELETLIGVGCGNERAAVELL